MANPPSSPEFDWKMYRYVPSLVAAAIATAIFSLLTLMHLWKYLTSKSRLIICVVIGASCEVAGFAARVSSHHDNAAWAPFIIQGTLLLIGPLFFAATIYMMLGRTIRLAGGEDVSFIRPVWYTRIFVTADISTLLIQGLGAGVMGTMQLQLALAGEKVVIAGLALQVTTFIIFLIACIDFHMRMNNKSKHDTPDGCPNNWRKMLWTLYSLSVLVLFRCIFRLIEYTMGNAAYLIAHEWALYTFDAIPMFLVLVLFLTLQPSKYALPHDRKMDESSDGELRMMESQ